MTRRIRRINKICVINGDMLAAAMRARDMSQNRLAAIVGVPQPTIYYAINTPERDLNADTAIKIARALDVDLSVLIKEVDGKPGALLLSKAVEIADRTGLSLDEVVGC